MTFVADGHYMKSPPVSQYNNAGGIPGMACMTVAQGRIVICLSFSPADKSQDAFRETSGNPFFC
jgi:hypothetical protein